MRRKITEKLVSWKNSRSRKPLLLYGARQVGKTYSVISFGKEHYTDIAYFNFDGSSELAAIFNRNFDTSRIIRELSVLSGIEIKTEKTLVIFDEIQSCDKALSSLKYFCENTPEYHIISAGSLLGVAVNRENYSFPVGKVDFMTLYPFDFEEFLWAVDRKPLSDQIKEHYDAFEPFALHDLAMDEYRKYLVVGGMPRAISTYIETGDYRLVLSEQKNIVDSYIADMAKYASPGETLRIIGAFNSLPEQLAKENKKFQYKVIKSGARAYDYELPLQWLKSAGIVIKCKKVTEGKHPVSMYSEKDSFKLYLPDSGLLCSKFGVNANFILSEQPGFENFKGALAENFVCAALTFNGYTPHYWESNSRAEVDFIIEDHDGNIIPIEVKSSENVRSKSLNNYISKYKPIYSIRISGKNFGFENNIKSIPLYAVHCV